MLTCRTKRTCTGIHTRAALRLVRARVLCQMRASYTYRAITSLPLPPIAGPQNCGNSPWKQSEGIANYAPVAATWRTRQNITSLIIIHWHHYVKKQRYPQNRKYITYCVFVSDQFSVARGERLRRKGRHGVFADKTV